MRLKDVMLKYRSNYLITQEQLAQATGVSVVTIIKAEKGEKISILSKAKIANYIGYKIEELVD